MSFTRKVSQARQTEVRHGGQGSFPHTGNRQVTPMDGTGGFVIPSGCRRAPKVGREFGFSIDLSPEKSTTFTP